MGLETTITTQIESKNLDVFIKNLEENVKNTIIHVLIRLQQKMIRN